jgi:hypothetical protein
MEEAERGPYRARPRKEDTTNTNKKIGKADELEIPDLHQAPSKERPKSREPSRPVTESPVSVSPRAPGVQAPRSHERK